jgi:membrane fusion protein, multidrug efflux system
MNAPAHAPAADSTPGGNPRRRPALLALTAVLAVAAVAYGSYWALVLNHYESTDNAYVQGHVVQVTPQLGGTVVAIGADDTDHVKAGQLLVQLDPADAQVALDQAEAQLAQTVREVRSLYAGNITLQAQIAMRQADLARTSSDVARAQDDVNRRAPLVATGAVGQEEFTHMKSQLTQAQSAVAAAQSALASAQAQLGVNQALTDGLSIEQHPNVQRAATRVREAFLALQRTRILSPVDGYVARRSVQLGQRVAAGAPLLSVVALDKVWVEGNFKEAQLRQLRLGQPVELTADQYGSDVTFHGQVAGVGAGTGAAFALLPAQNATGNWIKVVQRVPVRIELDPAELARHPLRVGLSMEAKVDVKHTEGAVLAPGARSPGTTRSPVFDLDAAAADSAVQRIVAANLGRAQRARAQNPAADKPTHGATGGTPAAVARASAAAPAASALR